MPEHVQYEDDDLFNPETHHESSDVPIKPLFVFIGIFIVFSILTHFVLLFFYKGLVKMERNRMEAPQSAVARPADADIPRNQPLLQPFPRKDAKGTVIVPQSNTPVTDLVDMRAAEDRLLHGYGWVDIVHIPIEEAKKQFAAKMAAQGVSIPPPTAPAPEGAQPQAPAPTSPQTTASTTGGAQQ
jgi:hypothetical protein